MCVCVRALVERERATMNKQYVALPDPTWERTNSGGLFRSVKSSMLGKFHFNLLIFGCPVGGGGGGGDYGTRMSVKSNDGEGGGNSARPAVVLQISLLSVFFWYCMEVPDPNLGGIVQYVTRRIPRVCLYCFSFSNYTFSIQR